jgi:hypothetical protein
MNEKLPKDLKLTVRTADQTRRADVELSQASRGSDLLQNAVDNWSLPADTDYSLVNVTTGKVLAPGESLDGKVKDGDVLEVQPVLVAGVGAH